MMKIPKYKYDIAFAFSKKDEHLVNQIDDLIDDNLITFFYSKKLEEIDRPNRELIILETIEKQSKMVVVLFRKKWGNTPWTKIEEQAVRKRASKEGFNFLLFIPLDHPPMVPKYVSKNQIWKNLGDAGIKGAASVIEEKFQLISNTTSEKLKSSVALATKTDIEVDSDKLIMQDAVSTLDITMLELNDLFTELKNYITEVEKENDKIKIQYHQRHKTCTLNYEVYSIKVHLQSANNKTYKESKLYIELLKHEKGSHEPNVLAIDTYHFEVRKPGEYGWIKNVGSDLFISSKKLAEKSVNIMLNQANKRKNK